MVRASVLPETALPALGYSISQVEKILGIPPKTGYRLIKQGKLKAFVDSGGALKVHPYELWRYMLENDPVK